MARSVLIVDTADAYMTAVGMCIVSVYKPMRPCDQCAADTQELISVGHTLSVDL